MDSCTSTRGACGIGEGSGIALAGVQHAQDRHDIVAHAIDDDVVWVSDSLACSPYSAAAIQKRIDRQELQRPVDQPFDLLRSSDIAFTDEIDDLSKLASGLIVPTQPDRASSILLESASLP